MIQTLIALPLIFFLPGYITTATFAASKRCTDFWELLFTWILLSVVITSLSALVLAELGYFSRTTLVLLLAGYVTLLFWKYKPWLIWRNWGNGLIIWQHSNWLVLGLMLIAGAIFFRPFENIIIGRDPGVYVNTGINIARTGGILIRDDFFATLPANVRDELLYSFPWIRQGIPNEFRFQGFYWDAERQLINPQFLHLYPIWIAIFYTLFGLRGALLTTPFFAWLASLGIYLVGKNLFNRGSGLAALSLLIVSPGTVWFARCANSEMLFQLLLFGGMLYWIFFMRGARPFYGVVSGLCLGALFLTRVDAVGILIPLGLFLGHRYLANKFSKRFIYFLFPFSMVLVLAIVHAWFFSLPYILLTASSFVTIIPHYRVTIPIAIILSIGIAGIMVKEMARFRILLGILLQHRKLITSISIASIVVISGYLYFIAPRIPEYNTFQEYTWQTHNEQNFVRLGWYLQPLGLLLAIGGLSRLLAVNFTSETAILALTVLVYSTLYLKNSLISLDHIFAARRYMTAIIPGAVLLIGYALSQLRIRFKSTVRGAILGVGLGLTLWGLSLHKSLPLIPHREFAGAIAQVQQMANLFPSRAIAIFGTPSLLSTFVAPPLTFIHGKTMFCAGRAELSTVAFETLADVAMKDDRAVFFVSENNRVAVSAHYDFIPVTKSVFSVPFWEHAVDHFPSQVDKYELPYTIYEIQRGSGNVTYLATDLLGQVGQIVADEDAIRRSARWAYVTSDDQGMLCYGPYVQIPSGEYRVKFRMKVVGQVGPETPVATLDVTVNGQDMLAQQTVRGKAALGSSYRNYELQFNNSSQENLVEFRVYFMDQADVGIDEIVLITDGRE